MATRGGPNINLLPAAGRGVVAAREQQQRVNLQAALARLQARAQEARLEEQAREFDVNAQIRQQAMLLDTRLKQADLARRDREFEIETGMRSRAMDLSERAEERLATREERMAEESAKEFGLRKEDLQFRREGLEFNREKFIKSQEFAKRTVNLKRRDELLRELVGMRIIEVDPEGDIRNPAKVNQQAGPLLEELQRLEQELNPGRRVTINQIIQRASAGSQRAIEAFQREEANRQLSMGLRAAQLDHTLALAEERRRGPERVSPEQQFATMEAQGLIRAATALETQAATLGEPTARQETLARADALRAQARKRLEAARPIAGFQVPEGPREERIEQILGRFVPTPPAQAGVAPATQQPGFPAPTPTSDIAARQREETSQVMARLKEDLPGLRVEPSTSVETITPQDRQVLQGFLGNTLMISDEKEKEFGARQIMGQIDDQIEKVNAAFKEKGIAPPSLLIKQLNQNRRIIEAQRSQFEENAKAADTALTNTMNNMSGLQLRLARDVTITEIEQARRDFAENERALEAPGLAPEERKRLERISSNFGSTVMGLIETKNRLGERASRASMAGTDLDSMHQAVTSVLGVGQANQARNQSILSRIQKVSDSKLAEVFGRTAKVLTTTVNTKEVKQERGQNLLSAYRLGILWSVARDRAVHVDVAAGREMPVFAVTGLIRFFGGLKETDRENALYFLMPNGLREHWSTAQDLVQKRTDGKDPATGRQVVPGVDELSVGDLSKFVRSRLAGTNAYTGERMPTGPENAENVVLWAAIMLARGATPEQAYEAVAPFDNYQLLNRPAAGPIAHITDPINLMKMIGVGGAEAPF